MFTLRDKDQVVLFEGFSFPVTSWVGLLQKLHIQDGAEF